AHIPMHLSSMVDLPRVLVEAYPRRSWRPGDMFVANDPYTSAGSHLNDIAIIAPVFAGGELIGFVANTAHHADVGGRVPGSESGPVRIRVAVRIAGDRVTLDFTGTEAQVPGAKNVPPVSLLATVYYVLKAVIDPDIPPNGGYYRAIGVVAPSGTVLNPLPPAAVAARFTTCQTVADVGLSGFAQGVPRRVV